MDADPLDEMPTLEERLEKRRQISKIVDEGGLVPSILTDEN